MHALLCLASTTNILQLFDHRCSFKSNSSQQAAQKHILQSVALTCPKTVTSGEESARVVLSDNFDAYIDPVSTVEDYDADRVSLQPLGSAPVPIFSLGCKEVSDALRPEVLLVPSDGTHDHGQVESIKPYFDKVLKHDSSKYESFIERLYHLGILNFSLTAKEIVTPFFVKKKRKPAVFGL